MVSGTVREQDARRERRPQFGQAQAETIVGPCRPRAQNHPGHAAAFPDQLEQRDQGIGRCTVVAQQNRYSMQLVREEKHLAVPDRNCCTGRARLHRRLRRRTADQEAQPRDEHAEPGV